MRFTVRYVVGALAGAWLLVHSPSAARARISYSAADSVEFDLALGDQPGPRSLTLADVSASEERALDLLAVNTDLHVIDVFLGEGGFTGGSDAELDLPDEDGVPVAVVTGQFNATGGRDIDIAVLEQGPGRVR